MSKRLLVVSCLLCLHCAPIFGGLNRHEFAERFKVWYGGIPADAADAICQALPGDIAEDIFRRGDDNIVSPRVYWNGHDANFSVAADSADSEVTCLCVQPMQSLYFAILQHDFQGWHIGDDTTISCHMPRFGLDTLSLGFEDEAPTYLLNGFVPHSCDQHFHLLNWDGKRLRGLTEDTLAGHFIEFLDLDSDGVTELNVATQESRDAEWADHVYKYSPHDALYRELSQSTTLPDRGSMTFEVAVHKDTFLLYEPIEVTVEARNQSNVRFPTDGLSYLSDCNTAELRDNNGRIMLLQRYSSMRISGVMGWYSEFAPGAVSRMPISIRGGVIDSVSGYYLMPEGIYTLSFYWRYDLCAAPIFGNQATLTDSTSFVVARPKLADSLTAEAYHRLTGPPSSNPVDYWTFYKEHRDSPYGGMALGEFASRLARGYWQPADDLSHVEIYRELLLRFPNDTSVRQTLYDIANRDRSFDYRELFREVIDSVPNSYAGKTAAYILANWQQR